MTYKETPHRRRWRIAAHELSEDEIEQLEIIHADASVRYGFYREKGCSKREAYEGAKAWARNSNEQAERRLDHATGATKISWGASPDLHG